MVKIMSKVNRLKWFLPVLMWLLIAGCSSGGSCNGCNSNGGGNNGANYNLVVDNTSPVPLVNTTTQQFYVYMTNVGSGNATDLSWSIEDAASSSGSGTKSSGLFSRLEGFFSSAKSNTSKSKIKALNSEIQILDASNCTNVVSGASCKILLQANDPTTVVLQSSSPTSTSAITQNVVSAYTYTTSYSGPEGTLTLSPLTEVNAGNGFAGYTFFIINNGTSSVDLSQAPFGTLPAGIDYSLLAGQTCPNPLPGGTACQVRLTVDSSQSSGGVIPVSLTPTGSVGGSPLPTQATSILTVSDEAQGNPLVSVSSFAVDANSSTPATSYGYVSNTGSGNLSLGSLSISSPATLSGDGCSNTVLAPGAVCRYQINISPSSVSSGGSATVTVPYTAGGVQGSTTGSAIWSYIPPAVAPNPEITMVTGLTTLTEVNPTTTLTLTNTGNVALLNVAAPTMSPQTSALALSGTCASPLAVGSACVYTLTYTPTGSQNTVVTFSGVTANYVDNNGSSQSTTLSSTTSINLNSSGVLTITPSSVTLGATWVSTNPSATVTVLNKSSSSITFGAATITGLAGGTTATGCTTIAPQGSCTLTISGGSYNGVSSEVISGSVVLNYTTSSGSGQEAIPVTVNYSGQPVITPGLTFNPNPIGNVTAPNNGASGTVRTLVTITNTTTATNGGNTSIKVKQSSLVPASSGNVTYAYSTSGVSSNACPSAVNGYIELTSPTVSCSYYIETTATGSPAASVATPVNSEYQYQTYPGPSTSPVYSADQSGPSVSMSTTVQSASAVLSTPVLLNPGQSTAFTNVEQGITAGPISFVLYNLGAAAVSGAITAPTINGFTFNMSSCSSLGANESCVFTATLNSSTVESGNLNTGSLTYNTTESVALLNMQYSVIAAGTPAIGASITIANCQSWGGVPNQTGSTCYINTGQAAPVMSLRFTNSESATATNFTANSGNLTTLAGSTYNIGTNSCVNATLVESGSCVVEFTPKVSSAGLGTLYNINGGVSYTYNYGASGQISGSGFKLATSSIVFVASPSLAVSLSESNIAQGESALVTATLSNWYTSGTNGITLSVESAGGLSAQYITLGSNSCTASVTGNVCTTSLMIGESAIVTGGYTVKATANVATSLPVQSVNFSVQAAISGLYIFVTESTYQGNFLTQDANTICRSDINAPVSAASMSWGLASSTANVFVANMNYLYGSAVVIPSSGVQPDIMNNSAAQLNLYTAQFGATGAYKIWGEDYVFFGTSNCINWTDNSSGAASGGVSDWSGGIVNPVSVQGCHTSHPLYCVQQPLPTLTITQSYFDRTEQDGTFTVTIPVAVASAVAVSVVSADTNVFEILPPATCSIAIGNTSCSVDAKTHTNVGNAIITASASGYTNGTLDAAITP